MNSAQHLWQFLSGKKTYLIALASTIYAWGIQRGLWVNDPLVDTLLLGGGAAALRHGWKTEAARIIQTILEAPPVLPSPGSIVEGRPVLAAPPVVHAPAVVVGSPSSGASERGASERGSVNMATLFAIFGAVVLCCAPLVLLPGCAGLAPGADPFIVRIEQAQASAKPGFDFVLHTEDANRDFWHTNTPGFYDFCEWLRQPQPVTGLTAFGTNIDGVLLPRASAMQWNLDQIKTSYKAGKATSNSVFLVLTTLESAVAQSATWAQLITNSPAH